MSRIADILTGQKFRAVVAAIVGLNFALLLAATTATAMLPVAAGAQANDISATPPSSCFLRNECVTPGTTGECDGKHCFVQHPGCPANQGACYVDPPAVPLAIHIGGTTRVLDIGDYIKVVYNFSIGFAVVIAGTMLVVAGAQYVLAGGSDSRVKHAKERILNALMGLAILLCAVVILNTVNPATLSLKMPRIEITRRMTFASCALTELCAPCGVKYSVLTRRADGATALSSADCEEFTRLDGEVNDALLATYSVTGNCVGRGCGRDQVPGGTTQCSTEYFRCAQGSNAAFACGTKPEAAEPGFACRACKRDGATCGVAGANDECCGGYCSNGIGLDNTCASGEPGDECDSDGECKSGICQTEYGNSCSSGEAGSPCDGVDECKEGMSCIANICMPQVVGGACESDEDCGGFLKCNGFGNFCVPKDFNPLNFTKTFCSPGKQGVLDGCCATRADCSGKGGFCNTATENIHRNDTKAFCSTGAIGVTCASNEQCASEKCFNRMCVSGKNGSPCNDGSQCESRKCYEGGDFSVCVSGGRGSRCDAEDAPCLGSQKCSNNVCVE